MRITFFNLQTVLFSYPILMPLECLTLRSEVGLSLDQDRRFCVFSEDRTTRSARQPFRDLMDPYQGGNGGKEHPKRGGAIEKPRGQRNIAFPKVLLIEHMVAGGRGERSLPLFQEAETKEEKQPAEDPTFTPGSAGHLWMGCRSF